METAQLAGDGGANTRAYWMKHNCTLFELVLCEILQHALNEKQVVCNLVLIIKETNNEITGLMRKLGCL